MSMGGGGLGSSLPFSAPVAPMLAQLSGGIPEGDFLYEPKWDGLRCIAFVAGNHVLLQSRNSRSVTAYFPELTEALMRLGRSLVLDGEIVAARTSFAELMDRFQASTFGIERLRREAPVCLKAFDVLAVDGQDLRDHPFARRRAVLESVVAGWSGPIQLTPATADPAVARRWLNRPAGTGIDGVIAKPRWLRYQPGSRAMIKVKTEHTADCVVAGFRAAAEVGSARAVAVASLMLGMYEGVELRHVGVCCSFTAERRRELAMTLLSLTVPLRGHPWEGGLGIGRKVEQDWIPVRPELVCEVGYDKLDDPRFRHPAHFKRWRPDRDARSCGIDQLDYRPGAVAAEPTAQL